MAASVAGSTDDELEQAIVEARATADQTQDAIDTALDLRDRVHDLLDDLDRRGVLTGHRYSDV